MYGIIHTLRVVQQLSCDTVEEAKPAFKVELFYFTW